jgi:hypothetical protein
MLQVDGLSAFSLLLDRVSSSKSGTLWIEDRLKQV